MVTNGTAPPLEDWAIAVETRDSNSESTAKKFNEARAFGFIRQSLSFFALKRLFRHYNQSTNHQKSQGRRFPCLRFPEAAVPGRYPPITKGFKRSVLANDILANDG
jgi:hypothetical protein